MELRHLRYFVAVAEELSFRGAADRLRLAQPSLGRQIRDLEEEIGERLFDRDRRRVLLTDAGNVLLVDAQKILSSADTAIEAARDAGRGERGVLRIGTIGTLLSSFLPASLAAFREKYPRVEVEILEMHSEQQGAAILAGAIQVGFLPNNRGNRIDARFATRPVLSCDVVAVVPARHRLAGEPEITLASLAKERFLNYRPREGSGYERWIRALCEEEGGFTPHIRQPPIEHANALLGMVAAREGIVLLPTIGLKEVEKSKSWMIKDFREPRPRLRLHAVWNPARPSVILTNYLALLSKRSVKRKTKLQAIVR